MLNKAGNQKKHYEDGQITVKITYTETWKGNAKQVRMQASAQVPGLGTLHWGNNKANAIDN